MATKPTKTEPAGDLPAPPSPVDQFFDIMVNRVVAYSPGITFRPDRPYRVKAKVKTELGDAVASADAVPDGAE